ncbi:MAG TPA: hypothetical protein VF180_06375, partial [Acidimicrobiia bacterium]
MNRDTRRCSVRRIWLAACVAALSTMTAGATAWAAPGGGSGGYSGGGGGGGGGYSGGGGGGGYSGGGGGGGYSGGGGSGGSGSVDDMPGWAWVLVVLFIGAIILNGLYQQSRRRVAFEGGDGRVVTRRAVGPRLSQRRKREEKVKMAAEEAAMDDAAFTPELVKTATVALHKAIVEAWTARDREALAKLVGPDLMVEWARRLDDFDRKGWHNITERLVDPTVE